MIELPDFAIRGSATPVFIDPGFTQRGLSTLSRIDRKGARFKLACTYGPFHPEHGRVMVARLIAAKQEGLRVPFPLLHDQGTPGSPLTVGAFSIGRTIDLDGMTPGYVCKEGYWLSLVKDGRHYLHSVRTGGRVSNTGMLTVTLNEMLRDSFADNTVAHLAKPMVEGLIEGDEWQWMYSVDRMTPIEFTLEEVR